MVDDIGDVEDARGDKVYVSGTKALYEITVGETSGG